MSNALAVREENAFELGKVFAESGMFPNTRKASEAIVKIIAGREFGLGPMAAMNGIHMVDGKPTLAANLIAGQIKRHPHYDYKMVRREDDGCELEFFERGVSVGRIKWERKDAQAAGLLGKNNWKKYPRDMYFARCLTSGARTFCPDVLGGSPIYTAEELGAEEASTASPAPVSDAPMADHEEVVDAVVVPDDNAEAKKQQMAATRSAFKASGMTNVDLAWFLISKGADLPADPTGEDIGQAMRTLTLEQLLEAEAYIKGEDGTIPGSGETA